MANGALSKRGNPAVLTDRSFYTKGRAVTL